MSQLFNTVFKHRGILVKQADAILNMKVTPEGLKQAIAIQKMKINEASKFLNNK